MSNIETKGRFIPFWFLNAQIDQGKAIQQLDSMHQRGINEVIVYPRYGLPKDYYLKPAWFYVVGPILREARKRGMGVWLGDDQYPSGTADGLVTRDDRFAARTVRWRNENKQVRKSGFHRPYTNSPYVDVMSTQATDAFIAATHQEYFRRYPDFFGSVIKGFFCDEPGMYQGLFGVVDRGFLPFSPAIPETYEKMHDESLREDFPLIWGDNEAANRQARLRYFATVGLLYRHNFLGRLQSWCKDHGVLLAGHLLGEEDPLMAVKSQADPFRALEKLDFPGYDLIGAFSPQKAVLAAKLARSVADTYSKQNVLAETFGSFGWGLTMGDMERIIRWQVQQGATILVPHALFYSLKGSRKYDAPPSLMEAPYWDHFGQLAEEFRLRVQENQRTPAKIAVYYPVSAIQAAYNPANETEARRISRAVQNVCGELEQVRQSLGIELHFDLLNDAGVVKRLADYELLYLPRATVLSVESMEEICRFTKAGGEVIFYDGEPKFAEREDQQAEFNGYMERIRGGRVKYLEGKRVPKLSLEAVLQLPEAAGLKYLLWHRLSTLSPTLEAKVSQALGSLEVVSGYLTRRFTGANRIEGLYRKVKGYF